MEDQAARILIVDDEKNLREYLAIILEKEGFETLSASSGEEALTLLAAESVDLVIQDVRMPGMDGIELLENIKKQAPELPVVIMTAFSTWETAVEAMRLGAYDFIKKPFENSMIKSITSRILEFRDKSATGPDTSDSIHHLAEIIGNSEPMDRIFSQIQNAARTEATVLLTGESGVGKELAARALHHGSLRNEENFISINCSALVSSLLENEIFGHAKGAFTGAEHDKKGLLELANKGTFFMDEIGDMDINLQGKLLKVLEDREYYPVGGTQKIRVDVRFIAATNQDLEALIENGKFRKDLYYRLNVIPVVIPPLRERSSDIPLLAGFFLNKYSQEYSKAVVRFSDDALQILARHPWPGNVRELENCVQRSLLAATGDTITAEDLGSITTRQKTPAPDADTVNLVPGFNLEEYIKDKEIQLINRALELSSNNITNAAELLGMTFRAIRYKIKKYGIATHRKDESE